MTGLTGWVDQHLPALLVLLPLLAAPVAFMPRRLPLLSYLLALVSSWLCLALAVRMLALVSAEPGAAGTIVYSLGGWAAPWGIEYRVDRLGALVTVIVAGVSSVVLLFARQSLARELDESRQYVCYTAWLLALTGMLGIAVTGDAFNLFVFLEIASLSSYVLVSLGRHRRALTAAFRYLVTGTIGATLMLVGVGLLYANTGTLNMTDLHQRIGAAPMSPSIAVAFALVVVGLGLKTALLPMHAWLPAAYGSAPSAVTALLAGTATKVALYALIRFIFSVFGAPLAFDTLHLGSWLLPLALVAVLVPSLVAAFQRNAKAVFAWSSLAQIGYMFTGLAMGSAAGLAAGIVHLANHALSKCALFIALGCVAYRIGGLGLDNLAGLGRRMPLTMAGFCLAGLSLIGVPLTAGFISKWYLLQAAWAGGLWPVVVVLMVSSLLAVVYVGRIVEAAYFREPAAGVAQDHAREAPPAMLVALWLLVALNIVFGINSEFTAGTAAQAAALLFDGVSLADPNALLCPASNCEPSS